MTFRRIAVYEDGEIREDEWNSKSPFKRTKIILANGQWQLSFRDKDDLDCGYIVSYFANGNVFWGEGYKGKWHGIRVDTYTDGHREIGEVFNAKRFGDWRFIEKDGTEKILKF